MSKIISFLETNVSSRVNLSPAQVLIAAGSLLVFAGILALCSMSLLGIFVLALLEVAGGIAFTVWSENKFKPELKFDFVAAPYVPPYSHQSHDNAGD